MALSGCKLMSGAVFAKFASEFVSGFLHEFVAVAAAFEDAGFEAAGTVGDFAGGDLREHQQRDSGQVVGRAEQAER